MQALKLAFDDNLGLPAGFQAGLSAVARDTGMYTGCELVSFHDVGAMLAAFDGGDVAMAFAPAGSLPYLRTEPTVVAEASFGAAHDSVLRSVLLVRASDPATSLGEAVHGTVGCVNRYCTTSYWAPMIALAQAGTNAPAGRLAFREAAGFDDMLMSVVDGRADAAMVWDAVLAHHPEVTPKLRAITDYADLPTPLLLANQQLAGPAVAAVRTFAATYRSGDPQAFFDGFIPPNTDRLARFRVGMTKARAQFGV